MKTYIVLLRGINVGGHKKVPMGELRELLSNTNFDNIKTYIQTGNISLRTSLKSRFEVEEAVQKAIQQHFGFEVSVLAKTKNDIERIFENCPFPEEQKKKSYFAILHNNQEPELVALAKEKTYEDESYDIIDDCIYFFSSKGYGQAKFSLNYFERKLKTSATARNYNTMVKLIEFSS